MKDTSHQENLFGRIAVACGFAKAADVDRAIEIQRGDKQVRHLGYILLDLKILTEEQLMTVLAVQRESRTREERSAPVMQAGATLGELAVGTGWATLEQIHECIEEQARLERFRLFFRLGEVMASRGVLTVEQVVDLLGRQRVVILGCPACFSRFNVTNYDPKTPATCLKCGGVLEVPVTISSLKVDGQIGSR